MIDINHQSWLSQLIGRNSSSLRPLSLSARCTRVFAYLTGDTLQRESGCFSKGASPSTVDNQFPLHTRARTTPISQGSSPSLLKAESWNQASDHPCLVAFHRARARARTHARNLSFRLAILSRRSNVATTEADHSPSQEESIRAMNDRWKSLRFRDGIGIRRRLFSWKDLSGRERGETDI